MLSRWGILLVLLAGCGTTDYSDQALNDRFVGKTKTELLSCAGIPDAQQHVGEKEVFTYRSQSVFGHQGIVITASCRFNFTLGNGTIESVRVNWSGPLIDQSMACDQIAQGCWEPEAPPKKPAYY